MSPDMNDNNRSSASWHAFMGSQLFLVVILGIGLLWAYWPTLLTVSERWATEPEYSHGWFVPLFSLFLLWHRRQLCPTQVSGDAWGLLPFVGGLALFLTGTYTQFDWLEAFSLIPCLFGVCQLAGGRRGLHWAWPAIIFLMFMLPLPFRVEVSLARPLQTLATKGSLGALVLLGFPATAEGNVIFINQTQIGVAEACNGLSMLLTFFALAVACALVIRRPIAERILIVLSAVPVALLSNIVRITITGVLYEMVDRETARTFYHDLAGWFMMLFALVVLWVFLIVLRRLTYVVEPESSETVLLASWGAAPAMIPNSDRPGVP